MITNNILWLMWVDCAGLPSQHGKTAIVTGGAVGIGFHVSKQLAALGAQVVIGGLTFTITSSFLFFLFSFLIPWNSPQKQYDLENYH